MKKRIAVTGANGFVGSYVTEALLRDGAEVLAINGPGLEIKNKNVKNCYADILNLDDIKSAFKEFQPDSIIHLAAIAAPTFKDLAKLYDINVHGSENIMDAAKEVCKQGTRLVLVSTAGIYGDSGKEYTDENSPYNPQNHYSYSKMVMEFLSRNYRDDLDIKIVRPFNFIGKGQSVNFIVSKFVKAFQEKEPVLKVGNIKTQRDYIDISFGAWALAKIATNDDVKYDVINVCTGVATSGEDIINTLEELTGYCPKIEVEPAFLRKNDIMRMVGDPTRWLEVAGPNQKPAPVKELLKNLLSAQ
ncbi:NAD-dependent epimerase/dehydratase family protein [bacterium]|nr:NAD-dependent epimerase/dehydratase family protein [bacterium]